MLSAFICGAGTIHHQDEDDEQQIKSPVLKKKKSKKGNKNPFSTRGLDKFSALLSELEEKKEKIYSQNGSQDISFVRFVYKNSDDAVPIVVKQKDEKKLEKKLSLTKSKSPPPGVKSEIAEAENIVKQGKTVSDKKKGKKKMSFSWRRPSSYLPVVVVLILLLLVFFGRSAVTLCTCVLWYIVPTLKGVGSDARKATKKKDYVRKLSDKRLVNDGVTNSPRAGGVGNKSPEQRGHRRCL